MDGTYPLEVSRISIRQRAELKLFRDERRFYDLNAYILLYNDA